MTTGNGQRYVQRYISFTEGFTSAPKVSVSLTMMDIYKDANARISCSALSVTRFGFWIRIETWADTKLYGAVCNFIAHGY